jgi:hypothetical protein
MHFLDLIAEQRIAEAVANGELDNLPGAGKPLASEDDAMVPAEVRIAYRVLRSAGLVPPELEARKEAAGLREIARSSPDEPVRRHALERLALLETQLEARGVSLRGSGYFAKVAARMLKG